jgi:hypothetical protein
VPGHHLDQTNLAKWRQRGLVGTAAEIRERVNHWHELGVSRVVCAFGMPFGLCADNQLDLFASTLLTR